MSTSRANIESDGRNAQRSIGDLAPMTITVMPGESEEDLEALREAIRAEWNPQGDHENFLVHQMVSARWRLERLARWEQEAIDKAIEAPGWYTKAEARQWDSQSPDRHVIAALGGKSSSLFDKLERFTRAAERAYSKAVKELEQHRAAQAKVVKQNEATAKQNKAKEAEAWLQSELAKLERRELPDPFASLSDREQNEPKPELDDLPPPPDSAHKA